MSSQQQRLAERWTDAVGTVAGFEQRLTLAPCSVCGGPSLVALRWEGGTPYCSDLCHPLSVPERNKLRADLPVGAGTPFPPRSVEYVAPDEPPVAHPEPEIPAVEIPANQLPGRAGSFARKLLKTQEPIRCYYARGTRLAKQERHQRVVDQYIVVAPGRVGVWVADRGKLQFSLGIVTEPHFRTVDYNELTAI